MVAALAAVGCGRGWAQGVTVRVEQQADAWRLTRGGAAYPVKGVGGGASKELARAAGANSWRTWAVDQIGEELDEARNLGMTVSVGFWLGHERHGFNYDDPAALARQENAVRETVSRFKDHPAVLVWALGNEMEIGCSREEAMWRHIDRLARLCKELDPNHPTMTVIAEVWDKKVEAMNRWCPSVDIVGINTYGGAGSIGERWRKAGGTRPYLITEFGPPGHWEMGKTETGAPEEWNSTRKARWYADVYRTGVTEDRMALGAYAFHWGSKVEATPTWYGLFLKDGSRLGAIEALTAAWGGPVPANRCPVISEVTVPKRVGWKPGETVEASVEVSDPDGDPVALSWVVYGDTGQYDVGGEAQPEPPSYPGSVADGQGTQRARIVLPGGGVYRIYAYARDGRGNAAMANVPVRADGPAPAFRPAKAELPFVVYGDGVPARYVASGYMGSTQAISMDAGCTENPRSGKTCLRIEYTAPGGWGGVLWQSPANDWGAKPGGFDLTGATTLVFHARGAKGGEKVSFQVGGLGKDQPYYDTGKGELKDVVLKSEWTRYRIPLDGQDLSRIKTGFGWVVGGQGEPIAFFVDDIQFTAD